jgi:putative acetyltransferase
MENIVIRPIRESDNHFIATIIRNSLTEFGAAKPGTVYFDETTDHLSDLFSVPGAAYFIAESEGHILGGAGVFPTEGLPDGVCELVKMYLLKQARGQGLGRRLIDVALLYAKEEGYHTVYLETMPELRKAVSVYEKFGFEYLPGPMGNSGHFGCNVWMKKEI